MTLQQLHYIITIAETGSINKAAETLYMAQPSLTSALRELEEELGFRIFIRNGRGVSLTNDGAEFMLYARSLYGQYEDMQEKFLGGNIKKKFCVSTQHYSFAVKAFVETVNRSDTMQYEFAIRETRTRDVIDDVANMRSEIGILYMSDFNRTVMSKLLRMYELEFHSLIKCKAYVYLWKKHPLANKSSIRFCELKDYPCLSFEQGDAGSVYYAEELLSYKDYSRIIKACDRATMLNLMVGLNGYTLCSGIICEELNGGDFAAVPLETEPSDCSCMEIGYIVKKNMLVSNTGRLYIDELNRYLTSCKTDISD